MTPLENSSLGNMPVVYDITYACGSSQFPHRGQITLPLFLSEEEVEQALTNGRQSCCPGCITDQQFAEAQELCVCLGLKALRGTERMVKLGEVVRARLANILLSSPDQRVILQRLAILNHPRARQARIWANYRHACWGERTEIECCSLLAALCRLTSSPHQEKEQGSS